MAQHNDFGKYGEDIAEKYLSGAGYQIIQRDWKAGHSDIDIIAKDKNELVFVEVKTRNSDALANPEDWVDVTKQKTYIRLANQYVIQNNIDEEVRFDIIGIVINGQKHEIHHLVRAFDAASAKAIRNTKGIDTPKSLGTGHLYQKDYPARY